MITLPVTSIDPVVRLCNWHDVQPDRSWGPRTIPDLELILVVRGRFVYVEAGREHALSAGDVLCIHPRREHTLHRQGAGGRVTFSCIHSDLSPMGGYGLDYRLETPPPIVTDVRGDADLRALFAQAARAFAGRGAYDAARCASLVRAIWLSLAERWRPSDQEGPSRRILQMQRYLEMHMADPVGRGDLARHFGLTPQHVNALFRAELNTTPTAWLNRRRCQRAAELLRRGGLGVADVGDMVGFSDPYYFSRVFRKQMGYPPSRFPK